MPIPRRRSLAGTNGIPTEPERYAVRRDARDVDFSSVHPVRVHWPDGRSWQVEGAFSKRAFGRAAFGNLCVRFDVTIARRTKTLWWEAGRWFVRRRLDARTACAR